MTITKYSPQQLKSRLAVLILPLMLAQLAQAQTTNFTNGKGNTAGLTGLVKYGSDPQQGVTVSCITADNRQTGNDPRTDVNGAFAIGNIDADCRIVAQVIRKEAPGIYLYYVGYSPDPTPPPIIRFASATRPLEHPVHLRKPSKVAVPSNSPGNRPVPDLTVFLTPIVRLDFRRYIVSDHPTGAGSEPDQSPIANAAGYAICGTVNGADRKRIPGASVVIRAIPLPDGTATSAELHLGTQIFTDPNGSYRYVPANQGLYSVTFLATGYQADVHLVMVDQNGIISFDPTTGITRPAGNEDLSPQLQPESQKPFQVNLDDLHPGSKIASPSRITVFRRETAELLPLTGWRSPDGLALLLPGVAPPPLPVGLVVPGVTPAFGSAGEFVVNGLRGRYNNFAVDGSDNNDEETGLRRQGLIAPFPQPLETLREFKVITAFADVTYGRGLAAQIDALSRSGTSSLHGQLWGFGTGGELKAQEAFNVSSHAYAGSYQHYIPITAGGLLSDPSVVFETAGSNIPLPFQVSSSSQGRQANPTDIPNHFLRSQGGLVLGGPLRRNATTFILSYERRTLRDTRQYNFSVPTAVERQICPRSATAGTGTVAGIRLGPICQSDNILFPDSLRGDAIWSLYPFPNNPLGPYGAHTFTESTAGDGGGNLYMALLSHHFDTGNLRHSLTVRYNGSDERSTVPETGDSVFSAVQPVIATRNAAGFFDTGFRSTIVNTFRMSYGTTRSSFEEVRDRYLSPSSRTPGVPFLINTPLLVNATSLNSPCAPAFSGSIIYVEADSATGKCLFQGYNLGQYLVPSGTRNPKWADQVDTAYLGQVVLGGFSGIGANAYQIPEWRRNGTLQVADSAVMLRRGNAIHAGFDVRVVRLNSTATPLSRPIADFHGVYDTFQSSPGDSPVALSSASLASIGVATTTQTFAIVPNTGSLPNDTLKLHATQQEYFLQDDISIAKNFLLTIGVRLQYTPLPRDASHYFDNAFSGDVLQRGLQECAAGTPNVCPLLPVLNSLMPKSLQAALDPAPFGADARVGFAWSFGEGERRTTVRGAWGKYTGQFPAILADEARNDFPNFLTLSGGVTTAFANQYISAYNGIIALNGKSPIDVLSALSRSFAQNSLSAALIYPAPGLQNPYAFQQGLTIERPLSHGLDLSLAYVGTEGRRLLTKTTPVGGANRSSVDLAILSAVGLFPGPDPHGSSQFPAATQLGGTGGWSISSIQYGDQARSSYQSLQATVRARSKEQLLQLFSSLTWAHSIDNSSDFFPSMGSYQLPQNSSIPSERASSDFDVRLRSVTIFLADSSAFCKRRLCRNWLLSGIFTAQTAQPYTINTALDVNQDGNVTDRLENTSALQPGSAPRSKWQPLAPESIASMLAAPGQSGVVGRNAFRGWGLWELDLAVSRTFPVRKSHGISLRAEIFNVLNHPNLGLPVRILESPAFGSAVSTAMPPRIIQFAVKYAF